MLFWQGIIFLKNTIKLNRNVLNIFLLQKVCTVSVQALNPSRPCTLDVERKVNGPLVTSPQIYIMQQTVHIQLIKALVDGKKAVGQTGIM